MSKDDGLSCSDAARLDDVHEFHLGNVGSNSFAEAHHLDHRLANKDSMDEGDSMPAVSESSSTSEECFEDNFEDDELDRKARRANQFLQQQIVAGKKKGALKDAERQSAARNRHEFNKWRLRHHRAIARQKWTSQLQRQQQHQRQLEQQQQQQQERETEERNEFISQRLDDFDCDGFPFLGDCERMSIDMEGRVDGDNIVEVLPDQPTTCWTWAVLTPPTVTIYSAIYPNYVDRLDKKDILWMEKVTVTMDSEDPSIVLD